MTVLRNQSGFSYILALTIVMIMGIMLGMVGQVWKTLKQRDLEEEMVFRGDQVAGIVYQRLLCKKAVLPPKDLGFFWPVASPKGTILDDLVSIGIKESCANGGSNFYRLRPSAVIDPMTGKQWKIVSPVGDATRFAGVKSDSSDEPFRKSFSALYDSKSLDDKKEYRDWLFTWELKQALPLNQPSPLKP